MVTSALLVLLAASASTIAFTPPGFFDVRYFPLNEDGLEDDDVAYQERYRRGTPEVTKPSITVSPPSAATAGSFSSSGSFSGSGSQAGGFSQGGGFGGGNFDSYPGYYGFPASYPSQSFNKQRPHVMPYDFYNLFQQFFRQLQLMAQQHAYAANYYTPNIESNSVDYGLGHNSDVGSSGSGSYVPDGGFSQVGGTGYVPPSFFSFPQGGGGDVYSSSGFSDNVPSHAGSDAATDNTALPAQGTNTGSSLASPAVDVVGAAAVASLSPQGGFGYADVFPDLSSRFGAVGGEFPQPSGNSYGVFTSSSSGSSDINGKKTSFKTATTGINDNGKVTVFTKHDP